MNRWSVLLLCAAFAPVPVAAQDTTAVRPAPSSTLTLSEAIAQARAHSPAYLRARAAADPANVAVRNAYASFIPTVDASAGFGYTGSGQSQFGGTFFSQTSPSYNSSYDLSLSWRLNGQVLTAPGLQKATRRATAMDISAAGVNLTTGITVQYLTTLQAQAQRDVAVQQLQRDTTFLKLAQARYQVGQATLIDVRQAEVTLGNAQVALLQAEQAANDAKLELLRQMGVTAPEDVAGLALTDSFNVVEPTYNLGNLLTTARDQNPTLRAAEARASAAGSGVAAARSEYFPTLSFNAGWSGFTQQFTNTGLLIQQAQGSATGQLQSCQEDNLIRAGLTTPLPPIDCYSQAGLTPTGSLDPTVINGIESNNNVFPFHYTGQPFRANLTVSLPIFTGFSRSLHIAQARAQREAADQTVREQQLQVRTTVQSRYLGLQTSYRAISVQAANRSAARDQLQLAQDRYRLGSGTALELADAQNAVTKAEADYVNSIYDYHKAVAQLEAAVGRPLR